MKTITHKLSILLILLVFQVNLIGQNVEINANGAAADASAILDLSSTNKGLLIPRISIPSAISASPVTSPTTSLLVYNTNASMSFGSGIGFYYWSGAMWLPFAGGSGWSLTGDAGTTAGTNFLGTTDAVDMVFKTNNTEEMRILSNGNVGIGTATPIAELTVSQGTFTPTSDYLYDGAGEVCLYVGVNNAGAALGLSSQGMSQVGFDVTLAATDKKQMYFGMDCEWAMLGGDESWIIAGSLNDDESDAAINILTMSHTGNTCIGGKIDVTSNPNAKYAFGIKNGTAPTAGLSNGILLYAQDVSSSSELKVRDEAGNVTTLSPHNFSLIPNGSSNKLGWAYYSEHTKSKKSINVDMLKLTRLVEELSGENLVYTSNTKNKNEDGSYSKIDKVIPVKNSLTEQVQNQDQLIEKQNKLIKELVSRIEKLEAKK